MLVPSLVVYKTCLSADLSMMTEQQLGLLNVHQKKGRFRHFELVIAGIYTENKCNIHHENELF